MNAHLSQVCTKSCGYSWSFICNTKLVYIAQEATKYKHKLYEEKKKMQQFYFTCIFNLISIHHTSVVRV